MATDDDRAASALDDLLQRAVRQGYLDPVAGRAARSGVDRLRTFLGGAEGTDRPVPTDPAGERAGRRAGEQVADPLAAPAADPAVDPAAVAAGGDGPAGEAAGLVRTTVPLRGGRRAELLLPERFDSADAERISRLVQAMALDEAPGPPSGP